MINPVLSARLPGRCITLNHCNAPAKRVRNMVMSDAGHDHRHGRPMMNPGTMARTSLAMGALLVALSGCQKQEGPSEQAGKQLDQTTEKVGEQIEQAGESIRDTAKGNKE